jgi:hypothetical protein
VKGREGKEADLRSGERVDDKGQKRTVEGRTVNFTSRKGEK